MTVSTLVGRIGQYIVNPLIGLLFGVALIVFLWGAAEYVLNSGDATKRKEGAQKILWGVIGMFIMVAVYGLVDMVTGTFGIPGLP